MLEINLDATKWTDVTDFYNAILKNIAAPDWHGDSINALVDSMIWGGINGIDPPYIVRVFNTKGIPGDITDEIADASLCLARARREFCTMKQRDVEVSLKIVT